MKELKMTLPHREHALGMMLSMCEVLWKRGWALVHPAP
jgi:hypothetical protein